LFVRSLVHISYHCYHQAITGIFFFFVHWNEGSVHIIDCITVVLL